MTNEKLELEKQRAELFQLLTTGARQVTHADKTVVFKSTDEIKQAIEMIDKKISGRKKTRIIKVYAKRGV